MKYSFDKQLALGEEGETAIDNYMHLEWGFIVEPVSMELQKMGIDRIVTSPEGIVTSIEIKSDYQAHYTSNIFIETVSVDTAEKLGWPLTLSSISRSIRASDTLI